MDSLSSLNLLTNPVVVFEAGSLRIVFANRSFEALFEGGLQWQNKLFEDVVIDEHDSFRVFLNSMVNHVNESGEDVVASDIPCTLSLAAGKRIYEFTISRIKDEPYTKLLIAELRDITEVRSRVEEQTTIRANEAIMRLKKSFLAMISHELRTPLNSILGMAQLLLDTKVDETQKHYIDEVTNSGRQLLLIINDLLLYLQLEQGKVVLEPRSFSVFKCIDDVADAISEIAEKKDIKVITHYDLSLSDAVFGDPLRIGQVLLNLASNAVKFTQSGHLELMVGKVESDSTTEDHIKFTVRDTGVGIPKEKLGNLSTPFTQIDDPFTRSNSGTGLGLSICQGLLRLMNSHLDITSEVGTGSQFSFTLALPKTEGLHETAVFLPKLVGKGAVVIVTTIQPFALSLANMFQSLGFECFTFSSQEEAALFIKLKKKIFLVLIDFETIQGDDLLKDLNTDETLVIDVLAGIGIKAQKRRLFQMRESNLLDGSMLKPLSFTQVQKFLDHLSDVELNPDQLTSLYDISVLVASKDPVVANVKKNILKSYGKDVDTCCSVSEAMEMVSKKFYHIAFLSPNIGDETSFQCAQKIRQMTDNRNPQITLIGIVDSTSKKTLISCIESGMDDFVLSPTSRDNLMEKLKKFCPKADFGTFNRRSRGSSGHSNSGGSQDRSMPRPESPKHRKQLQASRNSNAAHQDPETPESGHSRPSTPVGDVDHDEIEHLPTQNPPSEKPPSEPLGVVIPSHLDLGAFHLQPSPITLKPAEPPALAEAAPVTTTVTKEAPPSVEIVPVTDDPSPSLSPSKSTPTPLPPAEAAPLEQKAGASPNNNSSLSKKGRGPSKSTPSMNTKPADPKKDPSLLVSSPFAWWQFLLALLLGLAISLLVERLSV